MFRVLGPLEVEVEDGDERILLPGVRLRALLVALLLQPNTTVPAHRLIEVLWDEDPPQDPGNALHQVVRRLRTALGPLGAAVRTRPAGYELAVDAGLVDAEVFEAAYREAGALASADPDAAAAALDRGLALWRGPAYGEFAEGFARAPAIRLEELRIAALEERAALQLARGAVPEAVAAGRQLVAGHPHRPRTVEVLMRALSADGRAAEALDVYRRHRQLLADELGMDPRESLRELQTQILRGAVPAPREPPRRPPRPAPAGSVRALPWRPGPLLGRATDLTLLTDCLGQQRLVTLVGPGGVGKTRLAMEAAHRLAGADAAVWWADLSTTTAQRLVDSLAEATTVDLPRGSDAAGALAEALRDAGGLLCLDNAETVLADLAPLAERLLAEVPDLTLLVTSRERLDVGHEHVHVLAPLPVPAGAARDTPAVQLFIDRAPGLEAGALSDDDVAVIADTCRRLDGLPLAIELGAARAPTFGLREFAARLAQGLDLLSGGRRTAAARHRSVRAVVDWSFRLLSDDEARLFARLAVFPSSFTLGQAEAVCGGPPLTPPAVAPLLARLAEQSLVQAGDGRFWLLETLRAFAAEHLGDDERRAVRARHAEDTAGCLAAWSALLWTPREPEAVAALGALTADLHAAWAHAVRDDRPLAVRLAGDVHDYAYFHQRVDLLEWGLTVAGWEVEHPRLPDAMATAAAAAWAVGRMADAEELTSRGLAAAGGPDSPAAARVLDQRAALAMFAGQTEEAVRRYRQAAGLYRRAGEPLLGLTLDLSVCQVITYDGGAAEAAARTADLRDAVRASGNPSALAWWHYVLGEALLHSDPAGALANYTAAVEHASRVDNRLLVMLARSSAAPLLGGRDSPLVALRELGRLLDQWQDLGNTASQWWVLLSLAALLADLGEDRDAALLGGAVRRNQQHQPGFVRDRQRLEQALAAVRARLGDEATDAASAEGARMSLQEALAAARQLIRTTVERTTSG
ncbi:AfsR/SARP family transcriptional regulator [Modestobacter marinus]|uniref:AfsR/SARP family transcriptional regulator n=1 Tax=Modestobacter marinus TaxID=477641 RepID=UPI001C9687D6|nr:BTAD domain-containing putative transcriptional regulator [Modestobacter marinus]